MRKKWVLLAVAVILIAGIIAYSSLNHYQSDGQLQLAGLTEPVRVVRDEKGMPFIYAQNHLDATLAQGFIAAQDRLFQMELARRSVAGRLAEIFGEGVMASDIRNRTIGIHRAANRHFELLPADEKQYLQSYVDGINAYIETREDEYPLKIRLTGMQLDPWTPADSLAIFYLVGWSGAANLRSEILAQSLVDALGPDKAAEIFPININPDEVAAGSNDGSPSPATAFLRLGDENRPVNLLADRRLDSYLHNDQLALGSNNWAVNSSLSAGGRPILAGDPHLDARTLPGPIYPMGIITPQYRVVSSSIAGMPALLIGRNEYVATAVTNGYGDSQDLYIESLDPENPENYLEGVDSIAFEVIEETLKVKDKQAANGFRYETISIRLTKRGPVVSGVLKGLDTDRVLSLRWAMAESMRPTLRLDGLLFAKSVDDVKAVLKNWTMISGNWSFADVEDNIGFHASGRLPIRSQGDSTLPYPVQNSTDNWTGWIPFEEMPHSYNPSRGWVGSANHKVVDDGYPYYYSSYFSHSYRYRRMRELLGTPSVKGVDDHWQFQRDTRNLLAASIVPVMARVLLGHSDSEQLGQILANWNFEDDTELAAPLIFHSVYGEFARLVFEDELGAELTTALLGNPYFWQERLGRMILSGQSAWFDDTDTEAVSEDLAGLLRRAAALTVDNLSGPLGANPADWRWGDVHQIEFTSPLRRRGPGKGLLGAGSHPFPGSGETLHRGIYSFSAPFDTTISASLRMVADMADDEKILAVLPGGQSGRLFDSHRDDQLDDFISGQQRYWWFSDRAIEDHTESELTLVP